MDRKISIYEVRLREEFYNMKKLNSKKEVEDIIIIYYSDRLTGERLHISFDPSSSHLYPEEYFVLYKFPIYVSDGQLNRDWSGEFKFKVSSKVLLDQFSTAPAIFELDTSNGIPFNHHVEPNSGLVCLGGVWSTSRSFGLWYFVVGIGELLNQNNISIADDGDGHYNPDAYRFWTKECNKKPINQISWIYTLDKNGAQETPKTDQVSILSKARGFSVVGNIEKKTPFKIKKDDA